MPPAKELRNHHIVSIREVRSRCHEGDGAAEQFCGFRLVAPATDHAPDTVDVEIQAQRMGIDVHLCQGRLAAPWRPVDHDQPGHASSL